MVIKKVILLLTFALSFSPAYAVEDGVGAKGNPNVVGIFISQNGGPLYKICSGVYIKERIIATASHCIHKNSDIYVSDTGVDVSESPTRTRIVSFAIPAPENAFTPWNNTYPGREQDIAFLFTEKPLVGNPLTIASRSMVNAMKSDGATVVAYGYGYTAYKTPNNGIPYSYTLQARHRDARVNSDQYMSAIGIKGAPCPGDSGGPILSGNYLIGIVFGGGTWTCHNGTIHIGTWSAESTLVWPYEEYLEREYKAFLDREKPKPTIKKRKWRR